MISLQIAETIDKTEIADCKKNLVNAVKETLQQFGDVEPSDLTLVITNDEHMRQLNLQFRNIDSPTDVLAFPSRESDPDTGRRYLGDVLISYPHALAQATTRGHSVQDELALLVIHGVLHLLGFDHTNEANKRRMWAAQNKILDRLGFSILG